jgi:RHS repeat-associated protein
MNRGMSRPNEPGYTGKFEEPDLGIQNFGARWYNPRIGRFLAIDPAGFDPQNPQSFNRYAYENNNPYRYVDPDGRWAETALDVFSLGLSANAFQNDPSLGNGVGLAYDALATAVPLLPAGFGVIKSTANTAEAVGDVARSAGKTPEKLYHYTGADPSKIAAEGLKPGGSGKVFTTPDGTLSPLQAQVDLALPPNRGVPDHLLEIDVSTLRQMGVEAPGGSQVSRSLKMPGGGTEVVVPHAIPPDAIEIVR